jgi:hypothetical protein
VKTTGSPPRCAIASSIPCSAGLSSLVRSSWNPRPPSMTVGMRCPAPHRSPARRSGGSGPSSATLSYCYAVSCVCIGSGSMRAMIRSNRSTTLPSHSREGLYVSPHRPVVGNSLMVAGGRSR